jgi:hypothetical protein
LYHSVRRTLMRIKAAMEPIGAMPDLHGACGL